MISKKELEYGSNSTLYVTLKNNRVYVNDDFSVHDAIKLSTYLNVCVYTYHRCIEDDDLKNIQTINDKDESYFIYTIMKKSKIFSVGKDFNEANEFAKDIDGRVIRYVKSEEIKYN